MSINMIKASRILNRFLKMTLFIYLKKKFNLNIIDENGVKDLQPPYIILANHTNCWDPYFISIYMKKPVYFVTSDEYFRNFILRFLLRLVGGIPKTQFIPDTNTINVIFKVIRKFRGIIGIFPEGEKNWNGKTMNILYPTAKLVKALNVPVVTALLKGAYLSFPRWASKPKKGRIDIEYKIIVDKSKLGSITTQDIYMRIKKALEYDEYIHQTKAMVPYKGSRLAEHIELFLFTCPECKRIGTLKSRNNQVNCLECGYCIKYTEYGFFKICNKSVNSAIKKSHFDNPRDWDAWQTENLTNLLLSGSECVEGEGFNIPFFEDHNVIIKTGAKAKMIPMKKLNSGKLSLYKNRIVFTSLLDERLVFYITKMIGVNVQYNNQFEFYYDKTLYRFIFCFDVVSAYKWAKACDLVLNNALFFNGG